MNEPLDTMVPIDGELATLKTLIDGVKGSNQNSFSPLPLSEIYLLVIKRLLQMWNVISNLHDNGNFSMYISLIITN